MAAYKLTTGDYIIRMVDGAHIPTDTLNADYQAFLAWKEAGNAPDQADAASSFVPSIVTMLQARLAMVETPHAGYASLLEAVSQTIAAMAASDGDKARITWEFSGTVKRDHPLVGQLSEALGLSDADMDQLFILAATL